ncbi:MAG: peptidoglycan DD-metalloendopeptidase family protein [Selenomonadaceae bacterium]|nr:peptidoglycan DD-metalloendopeptidase family protein [Selenomonadaceae bacterium]
MESSFKKFLAIIIALGIFLTPLLVYADETEELENKKAVIDAKADKAKQKSDELWEKIESVSETKRYLDEEASVAIADYDQKQAALDQTIGRIYENEEKLQAAEIDYENKHGILMVRVKDIYINGQISYLDVLFGSKDFSDFFTRMDLLKRVVKQDYNLVQEVLKQQKEIKAVRNQLEADRRIQEELADKAEHAKEIKLEKVAKQQELIDKMKTDKAIYDKQYDEMMAASEQVAILIQQSKYKPPPPPPSPPPAPPSTNSSDDPPSSSSNDVEVYNATPSSSGGMIWPISGPITSPFGWRTHPIFGSQRFHSGLDIGGDYGLPIHAAKAGVVSHAGWIGGYGNTVMIDHGGGIVTLYGHNESLNVSVGQQVSQGQVIAFCGSTGNSTGPHCHFEVRLNGEPVSPYNYL